MDNRELWERFYALEKKQLIGIYYENSTKTIWITNEWEGAKWKVLILEYYEVTDMREIINFKVTCLAKAKS